VSACVSSLIPSAVRHPGRLGAMAVMSPQGLLEALSTVADPRKRRGVRHRFISILALCACAVLAGAESFIAIAEWAMDLTPLLRAKLGVQNSGHGEIIHAIGTGRRPRCSRRAGLYRRRSTARGATDRIKRACRAHRLQRPTSQHCSQVALPPRVRAARKPLRNNRRG
jgi:urease gamma subunit